MTRMDMSAKMLKEIKNLPFVTAVEKKVTLIKVTTKPVVVQVDNFRAKGTKRFGTHYAYYGIMNMIVNAEQYLTRIKVEKQLPHLMGGGTPCYGDDCKAAIRELSRKKDYKGVIKMIWFWANTNYPEEYSYNSSEFIQLLRNGFPAWDSKGNRIKLNDPARLKSGAQHTESHLDDRGEHYDANIKKYKNLKLDDVL